MASVFSFISSLNLEEWVQLHWCSHRLRRSAWLHEHFLVINISQRWLTGVVERRCLVVEVVQEGNRWETSGTSCVGGQLSSGKLAAQMSDVGGRISRCAAGQEVNALIQVQSVHTYVPEPSPGTPGVPVWHQFKWDWLSDCLVLTSPPVDIVGSPPEKFTLCL